MPRNPKNPLNPNRNADRNIAIHAYWNKGYSAGQIANFMGVTRCVVLGVVKRARKRGVIVVNHKIGCRASLKMPQRQAQPEASLP